MAANEDFTDCMVSHPRHVTLVSYPCLDLLQVGGSVGERLVLVPDHSSESRYEPRPLIDDPAVTVHSFRNGPDETEIYSISRADMDIKDVSANLRSGMAEAAFDGYRLIEDMEFIESCNGTTWLNCVTYTTDLHELDDDPPVALRISRKTMFRFAGHREWHLDTYELSLEEVDTTQWAGKLWAVNIVRLIDRRSDMAYLHAQRMLAEQDADRFEVGWAPPRYPDYGKVLKRMRVTPEVSPDPEENDPICREILFGTEEVVQVPCDGKHKYHLDCLVEVCKAAGPGKSRCPLCRRDMIRDTKDIDLLKYGVVDRSYNENREYSQWENFERSCADLDKHLAEHSKAQITVSKFLIKAIFELLTEGAMLELPLSTPFHLQPVRCADFPLLRQAVFVTAESMHGMTVDVKILNDAMKVEMLNTFAGAFKGGGGLSGLIDVELGHWWKDQTQAAKYYAMRPGFFAFAERMVSRMLQFVQLRKCDDTSGGMHRHGGRTYYHPGADEWTSSSTKEE